MPKYMLPIHVLSDMISQPRVYLQLFHSPLISLFLFLFILILPSLSATSINHCSIVPCATHSSCLRQPCILQLLSHRPLSIRKPSRHGELVAEEKSEPRDVVDVFECPHTMAQAHDRNIMDWCLQEREEICLCSPRHTLKQYN